MGERVWVVALKKSSGELVIDDLGNQDLKQMRGEAKIGGVYRLFPDEEEYKEDDEMEIRHVFPIDTQDFLNTMARFVEVLSPTDSSQLRDKILPGIVEGVVRAHEHLPPPRHQS